MQYSPKLKKAAEEIKAILKKYDIAANAILHTPGHSEYLWRVLLSQAKYDAIISSIQMTFMFLFIYWTIKNFTSLI